MIENFQQMLDNIFEPLFEVTKDPSTHPQLHVLLSQVRGAHRACLRGCSPRQPVVHPMPVPPPSPPLVPLQVVGFDMVDDESKPERRPTKHSPAPAEWNSKHNCAYSYYAYYIYANLYTLNKFREARGMNTFAFRPHAGEVRRWRWQLGGFSAGRRHVVMAGARHGHVLQAGDLDLPFVPLPPTHTALQAHGIHLCNSPSPSDPLPACRPATLTTLWRPTCCARTSPMGSTCASRPACSTCST